MSLQIGIVGLPNVGKSTLFNALTNSKGAEAANYPFCTIEPNVGIVEVPDERLSRLTEIVKPEKVIPAAIEFVDIAGLVKGASKGEGLGNKFLGAIREVDAICHVVRHFQGSDIIHVEGTTDPKRDREIIEAELIIADLESIDSRMDKMRGAAKSGDKEKIKQLAIFEKVRAVLDAGNMALNQSLRSGTGQAYYTEEENRFLKTAGLLTYKPIIYACNVSEDDLHTLSIHQAKQDLGLGESDQLITVSAKIEEDIKDLSPDDAAEFLADLGVQESGLNRLIRAAYEALGYITYFTAGVKEVRAWNIPKGSTAPQAAGVIHTDFEKGFIRAETIAYEDYATLGGEQKAKEAGKLRQEGKEYIVKDGDVLHFKFNV
ncbi:MAG: redox-regulated ATPase YchF [Candidatus Peregrinibacteria bacterium]|nr:redox-regulated ATPase YchF [Candidatus Peregrinibacteria bacterium]MCB9808648.1 redox-regulated ATPase YchF [Candidatus Peribacteria bacterium]